MPDTCGYCGFDVTAECERDALRLEVENLRTHGAALLGIVFAGGIAYQCDAAAKALEAFADRATASSRINGGTDG